LRCLGIGGQNEPVVAEEAERLRTGCAGAKDFGVEAGADLPPIVGCQRAETVTFVRLEIRLKG
jgi:hypothetical protein